MRSITRLKNFKWLFAAVIIAGTIIQACKKNVDVESTSLNNEFTPASVKEWYYSTFKKSAEWAGSKEHGKKLPDWKNGIKTKIAGWDAIEFPLGKSISSFSISAGQLTQADCKRLANASIAKVAFIKTKNNEIVVREVDYIPDWQYLQSKKFDISAVNTGTANDFTGRVVIKKWDGSVIATKIVVDGKAVKTTTKKDVEAKGATATNSLENCTTYEVCEWVRDCEIHYYGDGYIVQECSEWANTYCWYEQECTGGGDDCENYGIGCGGGGNGGSGGGEGPTFEEQIVDSLSPCRDSILVDVRNLTTGKIADMIRNFTGNMPGFNWKIVESSTTSDPNASATTEDHPANGYVLTTLNTTNLANATDLFVARTIMHEAIHAYLVSYFYNDPNAALKSYPELYDYWMLQKYPDINDPHHAIMADSLIHDISSALQNFAIANGYTNNSNLRQVCDQLAWGGLDGTAAYARLSVYDQMDINERNMAEKTSQHVGNATLLGTKACP